MSQCPQCYTGTCARHRRQDHGKSKVAMPANSQQTLQKMYDMLVGSKLQKLQAESERDPSTQSTEKFRQQLDASRDKNIKKSSSKSANRRVPAAATGSGLNPQALAALYNDSDNESGSDRKKTKKSRKSSSKKSKKHKKDKKSSSSSSSRKSKDKKRRHRHSRSASESDDSSSSSSDDHSSDSDDNSSVESDSERESDRRSSRKRSHRSSSKKSSKKKSNKRRRTDSDE